MKKGLSAEHALTTMQEGFDNTREEGLLTRLSQALEKSGIASGYTRLQQPTSVENRLHITHESHFGRSAFFVTIEKGFYIITSDEAHNKVDAPPTGSAKTPLTPKAMEAATGMTRDYNEFIGALEFILAHHYPTSAQSGKLTQVMNTFKRPEHPEISSAPAADQGP